jgi:hypothetical protein
MLENGCGYVTGTVIVSKDVKALIAVDSEPLYIQDIKNNIIKPFTSFEYLFMIF